MSDCESCDDLRARLIDALERIIELQEDKLNPKVQVNTPGGWPNIGLGDYPPIGHSYPYTIPNVITTTNNLETNVN